MLERKLGKHEAVMFARSATAGGQRFPIHVGLPRANCTYPSADDGVYLEQWGGDCESTYEAMAESLRGGLSLTSSGFAYWAHDIGGFEVSLGCRILNAAVPYREGSTGLCRDMHPWVFSSDGSPLVSSRPM
jgi:hypothetical protein